MIKKRIKRALKFMGIALTKNQRYDQQTERVFRKILKPNSNCIDVGCHRGEVLDQMISASPDGYHLGFEPIPDLFHALKKRYEHNSMVDIHDIALSDEEGTFCFNYVVSNPSYSGLRKRDYDRQGEEDTQIEVRTARLDDILPEDHRVDFIKIDVEGAEYLVLKGAKGTVVRDKPVIIFEFGMGAANHYNVQPADIFNYFDAVGMGINTLGRFLASEDPFSLQAFQHQYTERINYYFIAYPVTPK